MNKIKENIKNAIYFGLENKPTEGYTKSNETCVMGSLNTKVKKRIYHYCFFLFFFTFAFNSPVKYVVFFLKAKYRAIFFNILLYFVDLFRLLP